MGNPDQYCKETLYVNDFSGGGADPWPFTPICTVWLNNTLTHVRLKLATPRSRVEPPRIRIKLLKSFKSYLSLHRSGKISWTILWDFHILGLQKHQRHWSACAKKINWLISEPITTGQITKANVLWSAIKLILIHLIGLFLFTPLNRLFHIVSAHAPALSPRDYTWRGNLYTATYTLHSVIWKTIKRKLISKQSLTNRKNI